MIPKSPEDLYEERETRLREAIQLGQPDRVPVVFWGSNYFAARYCELPASVAYYDHHAWKEAQKKTTLDFEPDACGGLRGGAGAVLSLLDAKQIQWPGGTLPPELAHRHVDGEYMKADEYDLFLSDPSAFMLRYYLPRVFGALAPFSKLPPLRTLSGTGFAAVTALFATPEFKQLAEVLAKAGEEEMKWPEASSAFEEEMAVLGFPLTYHTSGIGDAPFDVISDYFRGGNGSMLDMYKNPEKLFNACEKVLQWRIESAVPANPKKRGNPKRSFTVLHRGGEGLMSKKQFETFYWPGLQKAILATIDLGFVPVLSFEGDYGDRIEHLLELPKGKVVCHLPDTDVERAKAVIGGHLCILGHVPLPLLTAGSAQEVEDYCRNLIKLYGKGGGLIITSAETIDEARPANVKAMVDSVKKYG